MSEQGTGVVILAVAVAIMFLVILFVQYATRAERTAEQRRHDAFMERYRSLPDGDPEKRRMARTIDDSNWV